MRSARSSSAFRAFRIATLLDLAAAATLPRRAPAATYTWTGASGTDAWSNANNWSGNQRPPNNSADTALVFAGTAQLSNQDDTGRGNFTLNSLAFANGAGAFVLRGHAGSEILLFTNNSGGVAPTLTQNSASVQTVNLLMSLWPTRSRLEARAQAA